MADQQRTPVVAKASELLEGVATMEHADVLAYKLPGDSGEVRE